MTEKRLNELLERVPALVVCQADLKRAFALLRDTFRSGHTVLLCGNGGSVADAEHWAGEPLKGFASKRELVEADRAKLPAELAEALQGALPAIPPWGHCAMCC